MCVTLQGVSDTYSQGIHKALGWSRGGGDFVLILHVVTMVGERGDLVKSLPEHLLLSLVWGRNAGVVHHLPKESLKALRVIHPAEASLFPWTTKGAWVAGPACWYSYWYVGLNMPYMPFWIVESFCTRAANCAEVLPAPGQGLCPDAPPAYQPHGIKVQPGISGSRNLWALPSAHKGQFLCVSHLLTLVLMLWVLASEERF